MDSVATLLSILLVFLVWATPSRSSAEAVISDTAHSVLPIVSDQPQTRLARLSASAIAFKPRQGRLHLTRWMGRGPPIRVLSNQTVREAVKTLKSSAPSASSNGLPPVTDVGAGLLKRSNGDASDFQSSKKRKVDESSTVEVSYTKSTLPVELEKYYNKRHELFSRYDEGIQMDREGWWSVTPEDLAAHMAERCRCEVIVDAFCGVGGNAIQFAFTCERVIAIDIDPVRLECARHNASIYGVEDRIEFICGDFVEWAQQMARKEQTPPIDVVFLSPPWGGIDYRGPYFQPGDRIASSPPQKPLPFDLNKLKPLPGKELIALARSLTPDVAIFVPRNTDPADLARLAPHETVEVEQQYLGKRFKGVTAYMGSLVQNVEAREGQ